MIFERYVAVAHPVFDGKIENTGRMVIYDHKLMGITDNLIRETENFGDGRIVYEVIRCIGGIPLFLEDHLDRLSSSFSAIRPGADPETEALKSDIRSLILSEGITDGNIKIVLCEGMSFVFPSAFYYPPETAYMSGVYIGLTEWERQSPNVKMIVDGYKKKVSDKLSSSGPKGSYFETLLVSSDGRVTEGSRSNVFFYDGNEILTAPDHVILKGITRKYVIEAITAAGHAIRYECCEASQIGKRYKSAFLSGTSIGVLPVSAVEDTILSSARDPAIKGIRREYEAIVSSYLESHAY